VVLVLGLALVVYGKSRTATLGSTCQQDPSLALKRPDSFEWATALAACIDKRGGRASVLKKVDDATGVVTYSVRWGTDSASSAP
jgi:hypothetical protein